MKHLLVKLTERNGEQEYRQNFLAIVPPEINNIDFANQVAKKWYEEVDSVFNILSGEYEFFGGGLCVSVASVTELPKEDFDVLTKYI